MPEYVFYPLINSTYGIYSVINSTYLQGENHNINFKKRHVYADVTNGILPQVNEGQFFARASLISCVKHRREKKRQYILLFYIILYIVSPFIATEYFGFKSLLFFTTKNIESLPAPFLTLVLQNLGNGQRDLRETRKINYLKQKEKILKLGKVKEGPQGWISGKNTFF